VYINPAGWNDVVHNLCNSCKSPFYLSTEMGEHLKGILKQYMNGKRSYLFYIFLPRTSHNCGLLHLIQQMLFYTFQINYSYIKKYLINYSYIKKCLRSKCKKIQKMYLAEVTSLTWFSKSSYG
jgi:hypothetical protein